MAHALEGRTKLLHRLRRIGGQIDAIEQLLDDGSTCSLIPQQATAYRGALDGFIAEVIEGHIREHMMDPEAGFDDPRAQAAEELVEIIHCYLT